MLNPFSFFASFHFCFKNCHLEWTKNNKVIFHSKPGLDSYFFSTFQPYFRSILWPILENVQVVSCNIIRKPYWVLFVFVVVVFAMGFKGGSAPSKKQKKQQHIGSLHCYLGEMTELNMAMFTVGITIIARFWLVKGICIHTRNSNL